MKLSVIIAAYNVESFIEKCVRSCYDFSLQEDYEIIVVNDGSNDSTLQIIERLKLEIYNLIIVTKHNQGLGAARNTGIEISRAEYVWMIDGDDFLESNSIVNVLSILSKQSNDVLTFNFNVVKEKKNHSYIRFPPKYIETILSGSNYYNKYFQNSYTWQYIFKKKLFIQNQLKFQERINMQDSEILPKIMFYTTTVLYIDAVFYNYVQQENSFTNTNNFQKRINYFESIIIVKKSLENFSVSIKDKDILLYEALLLKIKSLDEVVLNHVVYYRYSTKSLKKIITLLSKNNFYPFKFRPPGKLRLIKFGLNCTPVITNILINYLISINSIFRFRLL